MAPPAKPTLSKNMNNIIQSALSNYIDFKKEMPTKDKLLHELEPFLKRPMTLYGGYVKLKMEDSQACME